MKSWSQKGLKPQTSARKRNESEVGVVTEAGGRANVVETEELESPRLAGHGLLARSEGALETEGIGIDQRKRSGGRGHGVKGPRRGKRHVIRK